MQLPTILVTLLAGSAFAAPASKSSSPRQCSTIWPNETGNFVLSKSGPQLPTQDISFNVPENSVGPCTLVLSFPKGKGTHVSGDVRASVYEHTGSLSTDIGSLVGTVELKGSETEDTFRYINSFACKPLMSYKFRLDGERDGRVEFFQGEGQGIAMTVGSC
ncbi:hypothetical protein QBC37DRAFT_432636 [Rhypophila decipiens]|uniref:Ubiquitin 3 binding protein But2 C-terminal domain-containing protein n=1 Tax=Rhypophila decipiens TaxID=261697 RepID=A0AAN6XWI4_9PEZI|nr:hypothetical protein QBC37DRAFT_432636 [Rhypophila decipiens]